MPKVQVPVLRSFVCQHWANGPHLVSEAMSTKGPSVGRSAMSSLISQILWLSREAHLPTTPKCRAGWTPGCSKMQEERVGECTGERAPPSAGIWETSPEEGTLSSGLEDGQGLKAGREAGCLKLNESTDA